MTRTTALAAVVLLVLPGLAVAGEAPGAVKLSDPVKLTSGDKLIDVDVGHSAPYVCDWNRDGKPDLLVGQFGQGKLRVYLNTGTREEPKYEGYTWFTVTGGGQGVVPPG